MSLTEIAIRRPSLIVVIFTVLGVLGLFSYSLLSYELIPKFAPPVLTVATAYPGANPSEVENSVSKKVEDALSSMDRVKGIRTTSTEGFSLVILDLAQDADLDVSLADAQRKINGISNDLPEDAKAPIISKFALDEFPILRTSASAEMDARQFYQLMKDQFVPRFSRIAGVGQVTLIGGEKREIIVNVDADKARSYGLDLAQVVNAVNAYNVDFPTGKVKSDNGQYIVRVAGKFTSLQEMKDLVVAKTRTGGDVKLSDVAEVNDGIAETKNINRFNSRNALGVLVQKQNDANAVEVSRLARAEMKAIEQEYANIKMRFDLANDSSEYTVEAADAVKHDLFIAILLVAAVMLLFLHSFRDSVIVMISIPASIVSTFIAAYVFNFTLNLMTLLALSLVVGILVDDSIVVLENIHRHLAMGKPRRQAALDGRNEIGYTALSITLVDVVVFLPLAFVGGIVGNIMSQFAVMVVVSTLMSLFVSFTITPMLSARFSKVGHPNPKTLGGRFVLGFEGWFNRITEEYQNVLRWCLGSWYGKLSVFAVVVVLFMSVGFIFSLGVIGGDFIKKSDRGEFSVIVEGPQGATIEETNRTALYAERRLQTIPEVRKIFTNVGSSTDGFLNTSSNNVSEITVALSPREERSKSTDDIILESKQLLRDLAGYKIRVNPIGFFGTADETPIQIIVMGNNPDSVARGAAMVKAVIDTIPGTDDVRLSAEDGKPEARVDIDRQKMANLGLNIAQVGLTLRTALTGDDRSKYRDAGTDYDIRVQLDGFDRTKPDDLASLTFRNAMGQLVELKQFATVTYATGPTRLQRTDRNASVMVLSQVIGRAVGDVGNDFKATLAKTKLPQGTSIQYQGQLKFQSEGMASMMIAIGIGSLFVYLIMVALYDSYFRPFVAFSAIPVAIIGAMYALGLTRGVIDIFTMLGMLMLIGLVTKNSILIVDFTNHLRERGMATREALIEAGRERLRPIVMTTVAMVIGMLPIALSEGAGSEWKHGLAWALIGGLISSMLLTLVLVPVVYMVAEDIMNFLSGLLGKIIGKKQNPAEGDTLRYAHLGGNGSTAEATTEQVLH